MATKPPDAFLSYTRFDDRRGDISAFREHLEDAVREVTGEPFEIFQDVDDIEIGERWSDKLDEILGEARFFIPILTPSYFNSAACRDELQKFLNAEVKAGRRDLILPIYYIRCTVLEDKELRRADDLATAIHQRQRWEWRELRHYSFRNRTVRLKIATLGEAIAAARHTRMPRRAAPVAGAADQDKRAPQVGLRAGATQAPEQAGTEALTVFRERMATIRGSLGIEQDTGDRQDRVPSFDPGRVFRDVDAPWCPELVVIAPGEFMMGSTEAERKWAIEQSAQREWVEWERPQHLVRIAYPLGVGRYPVTFDEYGHFARTTGRTQPSDEGWGRGRRPVINVDREDAKTFVAWLAVQVGHAYRLLSESEWEYVCRAGTTTRYWWGDEITPENANYGTKVGKTSDVGKYPANPFGLCDMHGNVWEWVEDRWHDSYHGAPDDGSAWIAGSDSGCVVRGGSRDNVRRLRSASRYRVWPDFQGNYLGFRVARTLLSLEC
jgi:formylglycine-generating enzyme required for sulfatase activity